MRLIPAASGPSAHGAANPWRADPPDGPVARVGSLPELAATVPYLLGFVPQESVTCVALGGRTMRRVGVTARVDLDAVVHPVAGPALLDQVFAAAARGGAATMVALVSSERAAVDPVVVARLQDAADCAGVGLLDVGWHRDGRCSSLLCGDARCCPPEGLPVDPACVAAVEATVAGVAVKPDRRSVEAEFDRSPAHDPEALDAAIAGVEAGFLRASVAGDGEELATSRAEQVVTLAAAHDLAATEGRPAPPVPDTLAATCLAALADIEVRDAVWLAVDAREVDGSGLWLDLARRAPVPYDASPLFLLGWRSWRAGDGVRAVIAAERAASTPGGYSAARLLLDAIDAGVDPRGMPPLTA